MIESEYSELECIHKDHKVQLMSPHWTTPKLDHMSANIVEMLLELQQVCCCDYFPR